MGYSVSSETSFRTTENYFQISTLSKKSNSENLTEVYSYGLNGQEKETEIIEGVYTAEYWEYDSRLGRRWNADPVVIYSESPYATFNNSPIVIADPLGNTGEPKNKIAGSAGSAAARGKEAGKAAGAGKPKGPTGAVGVDGSTKSNPPAPAVSGPTGPTDANGQPVQSNQQQNAVVTTSGTPTSPPIGVAGVSADACPTCTGEFKVVANPEYDANQDNSMTAIAGGAMLLSSPTIEVPPAAVVIFVAVVVYKVATIEPPTILVPIDYPLGPPAPPPPTYTTGTQTPPPPPLPPRGGRGDGWNPMGSGAKVALGVVGAAVLMKRCQDANKNPPNPGSTVPPAPAAPAPAPVGPVGN